MEVLILHASTPKRIEKFNKIVSELKIPFDGKYRKGHAYVFPYKVEPWIYKTKLQAMPEFLKFVKGNTMEISTGWRPLQGLLNFTTGIITVFSKILRFFNGLKYRRRKGYKCKASKNSIDTVKMNEVKPAKKIVPGWGYSKVICTFPDHTNARGEEEL